MSSAPLTSARRSSGRQRAVAAVCPSQMIANSSYTMSYTVSQKTVQNCFCQNFVKFLPIWIIFGRKMAKRLKLCKIHSFSTSSNSHDHITVLNTDVRNCYTTLKVVICSKLSDDLNSTSKVKCGLFTRIISLYDSSVQNCQNLCSKWAPRRLHRHKRLDDDVTDKSSSYR